MTETTKTVTKFDLRDYQEEAREKIRDEFRAGKKRVVLQLATGGGKTAIAASMISGALERGKRSLFICDRIELIEQTSRRFDAEGIPHGVIQGQHERYRPWEPVQICSIQTLAVRKRWPEAGFIIQDECHSCFKAMNRIIERWSNIPMVGLSATPWSRGLGRWWESLVVGATTSELIEKGFLVPFRVYGPAGPDLSGVKTVAGEYHEGQLGLAVDKPQLVADIVSTWKKYASTQQTICFAVNIAHSKHIVERFRSEGIRAEHLDAYSPPEERRDVLRRFDDGDVQLVSSVDLLTKGYDSPQATCMIDARPTKSLILHVQKTGRVLRIHPGKTEAIILDHAGNTSRLGFVSDEMPCHLDDGKRKEGKPVERKEPLPKPCPACHFMKPAKVYICPACGFKPERISDVETAPGELVELRGKQKQKKAKAHVWTKEQKGQFYGELKALEFQYGYKKGWAAHQYREKHGVWPNHYNDVPMSEPSQFTINYVRHRQMKRAFGRK